MVFAEAVAVDADGAVVVDDGVDVAEAPFPEAEAELPLGEPLSRKRKRGCCQT